MNKTQRNLRWVLLFIRVFFISFNERGKKELKHQKIDARNSINNYEDD